jgi:hypothetical protein
MTMKLPTLSPSSLSILALSVLGLVVTSQMVIAKPKPSVPQTVVPVSGVTAPQTSTSETTYWQNLLNDLRDDYTDEVSLNLLDILTVDVNFRSSLLDLFLGQEGDDAALRSILIGILLDRNVQVSQPEHFTYVLNYSCLPPGQAQRLASGKPVPAGIIKKCGQVQTISD